MIHFCHLDKLRKKIHITDHEHTSLDIHLINKQLKIYRGKWKAQKKKCFELRMKFLEDHAALLAEKMRTTDAKALHAIKRAEESKCTFCTIKQILGKQRTQLTDIDVPSSPMDMGFSTTTISNKQDVEYHLIHRNKCHSRQSLSTPFFQSPTLQQAIDPHHANNSINDLLQGTFQHSRVRDYKLNDTEKKFLESLKTIVTTDVPLHLSLEDFRQYFKSKQEGTASSPSGRHMGHYRAMLECLHHNTPTLPSIILNIAMISLQTATPLHRWQQASQLMLEKGKGKHIDNLRIIQLCEADLNFILHVVRGKRLIRHASHHLDKAQFAIPGQTCHNAVISKQLYLDLSQQTFSTGLMIDYNAKAVFDRVISGIANLACRRFGLPKIAGDFMHNLLFHMTFHLVTGFSKSAATFSNADDLPNIGQGVLQGSSSACPIYILNSDICLQSYRRCSVSTWFIHPIKGTYISDHVVQFVDDTTQFINALGTIPHQNAQASDTSEHSLFTCAQKNVSDWNDLIWFSGGKLQPQKCYYYSFIPWYNFKKLAMSYTNYANMEPLYLHDHDTNNRITLEHRSPDDTRRTLGVILAPNGSASKQLQHTTQLAKE